MQYFIVDSIMEAEYIAAWETVKEVSLPWLFLMELDAIPLTLDSITHSCDISRMVVNA